MHLREIFLNHRCICAQYPYPYPLIQTDMHVMCYLHCSITYCALTLLSLTLCVATGPDAMRFTFLLYANTLSYRGLGLWIALSAGKITE